MKPYFPKRNSSEKMKTSTNWVTHTATDCSAENTKEPTGIRRISLSSCTPSSESVANSSRDRVSRIMFTKATWYLGKRTAKTWAFTTRM